MVYLAWGPLGLEPVERFARSYLQHPTGIAHQLIVARKAQTADRPARARLEALVGELGASAVSVADQGLDLDSYAAVVREARAETFCFLNTSSEILADGWLALLAGALAAPGVGLVGATGSWESALSAAPRPLRPMLRRRYPPFPNPHVRTNAFMLAAPTLRRLRWPPARRKARALALESGRDGISRQVLAQGLQIVVAGADGRVYPWEQWSASRTFRKGEQENLLVADNRTRQYASADARERARLAGFAWGSARS